ncbi:MAG: ABC transporter ATP-binding protein [Bdellovibrionales bacterium]
MSGIQVKNLKKSFRSEFWLKKIPAIDDLSFNVEAGKITGFLGANGAGKSTSIKSILGLLIPDSGEILFDGRPLDNSVRTNIGFLPERPFFYEYLDGREFLEFYSALSGQIKKTDLNQRIDRVLTRVGLIHAKEKKLRAYSKGMLQRIGIAQCLIHDPQLVVLDEPMTGLDPDGRFEVAEIIREVGAEGRTVFFSSHLLDDVEKLSENLVILRKGDCVFEGELKKLLTGMDIEHEISFYKQDSTVESLTVKDHELQSCIDQLRLDGKAIHEITLKRTRLEDVFVELNK